MLDVAACNPFGSYQSGTLRMAVFQNASSADKPLELISFSSNLANELSRFDELQLCNYLAVEMN